LVLLAILSECFFDDGVSGDGGTDRESVKGERDSSVRETKHGGESLSESTTV
jgi:hypothetical protein